MREQYQSIIEKLQVRIDAVSRKWVEEQNPDDLWEYKALVSEMEEIKDAITKYEMYKHMY